MGWWWESKNTASPLVDGAATDALEGGLPDSPKNGNTDVLEVAPHGVAHEPESVEVCGREGDAQAEAIHDVQSSAHEGIVKAEDSEIKSSISRYWIPSWIGPAPSIHSTHDAPRPVKESANGLDNAVSTPDGGNASPLEVGRKSDEAIRPVQSTTIETGEQPPKGGTSIRSQAGSPSKDVKEKPNLIFPDFDVCFDPMSQPPSLLGRLWCLLASSKHCPRIQLSRKAPATISRAVCIGIHGYFPIKMIRSLIGEPTGTSLKFATAASMSIKQWGEQNHQDPEISLISLEGEGKVAKRLEMLHQQLEDHMSQIVDADFIFVACHSQGSPVAVQLVAKMISDGKVDHAKIVILCMASVSLGPFPALQSSLMVRAYNQLDTEAAQELFGKYVRG